MTFDEAFDRLRIFAEQAGAPIYGIRRAECSDHTDWWYGWEASLGESSFESSHQLREHPIRVTGETCDTLERAVASAIDRFTDQLASRRTNVKEPE